VPYVPVWLSGLHEYVGLPSSGSCNRTLVVRLTTSRYPEAIYFSCYDSRKTRPVDRAAATVHR